MWKLGGVFLLLCGCTTLPAGELRQAVGEIQDGFPNKWERALFMAANRARSDPSTLKGPASAIYPPRAPLVWAPELAHSARFHATTLEYGRAPLMHESPCTLKSDVGSSGCDGKPACACTTGATCMSCGTCAAGTNPFTRIAYFYRGFANGEIAAAGYGDPFGVMDGWVDEPAGSDGHRQIVDGDAGVVGFGHSEGAADACWGTFDIGDFGAETPTPPRIASAAAAPLGGGPGSYTIYATWNDPAGGAPRSLSAVVDGKCTPMTRELGDDRLNATWLAHVTLSAGCHAVYVLGADASGARVAWPGTTAFTIDAGGAECADELPQPPPDCDPTFTPPDLGQGPSPSSPPNPTNPDPTDPDATNPTNPDATNPTNPDPQNTSSNQPHASSGIVVQGGCDLGGAGSLDGTCLLLLLAALRRLTRKR
jgi:hypothetical protein